MRAVVLRNGRLEVRDTADPVPGPGHLLLRVVSTAICASDVHFMDHHDAIPDTVNVGMVYDEHRDRSTRRSALRSTSGASWPTSAS
jgi:NADPH:quinone reductase-like Zn-dependent oxidoreductase